MSIVEWYFVIGIGVTAIWFCFGMFENGLPKRGEIGIATFGLLTAVLLWPFVVWVGLVMVWQEITWKTTD